MPARKNPPAGSPEIKTQHRQLSRAGKTAANSVVTFNQLPHQWQRPLAGEKYAVFRATSRRGNDRDWWHSHYNRIVLIGGGYTTGTGATGIRMG